MNLPAASGRGILMDYLSYFSPQAAGNLPKVIKNWFTTFYFSKKMLFF
jgi:hypothetical protein